MIAGGCFAWFNLKISIHDNLVLFVYRPVVHIMLFFSVFRRLSQRPTAHELEDKHILLSKL